MFIGSRAELAAILIGGCAKTVGHLIEAGVYDTAFKKLLKGVRGQKGGGLVESSKHQISRQGVQDGHMNFARRG